MAAQTRSRVVKPPPRRGVPYYDSAKGAWFVLPSGGGKVRPHPGPQRPRARGKTFRAKEALRHAGVTASDEAVTTGTVARDVARSSGRRMRRAGVPLQSFGGSSTGIGGLAIYFLATIVGLALLQNLLGGRGPAAYEKLLGGLGRLFAIIASPTGGAVIPAASAPSTPPAAAARSTHDVTVPTTGGADVKKWVSLGPGADRKGMTTKVSVLVFVARLAKAYGQRLIIGTGTNHNRLTVDGNVSDHWTGHAADIPASGSQLIRLGRLALELAGMPRAKAQQQTGGLFNVGGYQIIFNTHLGGDHTDHLHVGVPG